MGERQTLKGIFLFIWYKVEGRRVETNIEGEKNVKGSLVLFISSLLQVIVGCCFPSIWETEKDTQKKITLFNIC